MHSLGPVYLALMALYYGEHYAPHMHGAHDVHRQAVLLSHSGNFVGCETLQWLGADGDGILHPYNMWTAVGATVDVDLFNLCLVLCGRYVS